MAIGRSGIKKEVEGQIRGAKPSKAMLSYKEGGESLKEIDSEKNPGLSKLPQEVRNKMGYMKDGGDSKPGLYANINRRKKLGISRPKSKSTISKEAYSNMKKGFPDKKAVGGLAETEDGYQMHCVKDYTKDLL
jgi:hypothetical protein